jgi:hypothetical protein
MGLLLPWSPRLQVKSLSLPDDIILLAQYPLSRPGLFEDFALRLLLAFFSYDQP